MGIRQIVERLWTGEFAFLLDLPPVDFLAVVFMALVVTFIAFGLVSMWLEEHRQDMERNRVAAERFYAEGQKAALGQDYVSAYAFFNRAASWNYYGSGTGLRDRAAKNRDELASKMTPTQIAEAQKRPWT